MQSSFKRNSKTVHLEIRLVVAVDDAGQEVAEGLPGPGLCDSHHVLQRTRLDCFPLVSFLANYVFQFFVLWCSFVCFGFWVVDRLFVYLSGESKRPALRLDWSWFRISCLP